MLAARKHPQRIRGKEFCFGYAGCMQHSVVDLLVEVMMRKGQNTSWLPDFAAAGADSAISRIEYAELARGYALDGGGRLDEVAAVWIAF